MESIGGIDKNQIVSTVCGFDGLKGWDRLLEKVKRRGSS